MKHFRNASGVLAVAALFSICPSLLGQTNNIHVATIPGYTKVAPVPLDSVRSLTSTPVLVYPAGAATSKGRMSFDENGAAMSHDAVNADSTAKANAAGTGSLFGVDSVPTFEGAFAATGGPSQGQDVPFIMMGNNPQLGGTTEIPAKITTVALRLLKEDGSLNQVVSYNPFEDLTLDSPVFQNVLYGDGRSQFTDAIQRAEFFNMMKQNWHTRLDPTVVNRVTVTVPQFVNVRFPDGTTTKVQTYTLLTAKDGHTVVLLLDLFFNNVFFNTAVNDINAGNDTTDAFNMQLYPNTFLFSIDAKGKPAGCCVLGFHTFLSDNAVPQHRFVTAFASWTSPGLFGGGVEDITPLSHEVTEAFNDPFGDNAVPNWQFPGVAANAQVCQANLETGDPVEVLGTSTVPIPRRDDGKIFTFHPQTEALWQWFTQGPTSNAIDGAFSYPDEAALPHSALPCPPAPPAP